jgi:hypothetical protein
MDTWMVSGTMLKINCVNLQIPPFGNFTVYSASFGSLEKWIKEQSRSIWQGKDSGLLGSMPVLLPRLDLN